MKKRIISIIIIILVIIIIVGIWLIKSKKSNEINESQVENPDFDLNITDKFNLDELKEYKLPIIIDFGAETCIPCRQMAPTLKQLNKELQGKAIIRYVDVWEFPDAVNDYPVELIPTQIFFNSDGMPYAPENPEEMELNFITDENGNHTLTTHIGILTINEMKYMLREMGLNE